MQWPLLESRVTETSALLKVWSQKPGEQQLQCFPVTGHGAEQARASVSSDAEATIIDPICYNKDRHTAVPHYVLDEEHIIIIC